MTVEEKNRTATETANAMMVEDGFISIASEEQLKIGSVWPFVEFYLWDMRLNATIPGPVVVIGESSEEEFTEQMIRFELYIGPPPAGRKLYFFRIAAE